MQGHEPSPAVSQDTQQEEGKIQIHTVQGKHLEFFNSFTESFYADYISGSLCFISFLWLKRLLTCQLVLDYNFPELVFDNKECKK